MKIFRITCELCITGLRRNGYEYNVEDENYSLHLENEPDNPYDNKAVRVDLEGRKIGYITRQDNQNQEIFKILDDIVEPRITQWRCVYNAGGYMLVHLKIVSQ